MKVVGTGDGGLWNWSAEGRNQLLSSGRVESAMVAMAAGLVSWP